MASCGGPSRDRRPISLCSCPCRVRNGSIDGPARAVSTFVPSPRIRQSRKIRTCRPRYPCLCTSRRRSFVRCRRSPRTVTLASFSCPLSTTSTVAVENPGFCLYKCSLAVPNLLDFCSRSAFNQSIHNNFYHVCVCVCVCVLRRGEKLSFAHYRDALRARFHSYEGDDVGHPHIYANVQLQLVCVLYRRVRHNDDRRPTAILPHHGFRARLRCIRVAAMAPTPSAQVFEWTLLRHS